MIMEGTVCFTVTDQNTVSGERDYGITAFKKVSVRPRVETDCRLATSDYNINLLSTLPTGRGGKTALHISVVALRCYCRINTEGNVAFSTA